MTPTRPATALVLTTAAASTLLGAAVVHASVVDEHLREWWLEGVFFLALQIVETALAFALVARPSRRLYWTAIAVSLATVALWAVSRTSGIPVGPGAGLPEAVGRADVVASALELATALVLVPLVRFRGARVPRIGGVAGPAAAAAVVLVVAAATAFGLARPAAAGHGHAHGHGGHLGPGEYPLGEPLHTPTESRGPGFYFAAFPLPRVVVELGVGPDVAGVNTFDVIVVDHVGNRVELPDVRVTARLPAGGIGPLRFRAGRLSPGHFVVDVARLPRAGSWSVRVEGRRRAGGPAVFGHTFDVPVGRAAPVSGG